MVTPLWFGKLRWCVPRRPAGLLPAGRLRSNQMLCVQAGLGVELDLDLFARFLGLHAGFAAGSGGVTVPGGGASDVAPAGGVCPSLHLDVVRCTEAVLEPGRNFPAPLAGRLYVWSAVP